jgi:hypothetical protein
MKREHSSLARSAPRGLTWSMNRNQETQVNRRRIEKAKAESGVNPLWVIAVAMAIFFAAATAIIALT